MLQFEYDIRSHKIKALNGKSKQLAVGIAFIISAVILFAFTRYLDVIGHCRYFAPFIILLATIYTLGILLGYKFMYPREYLKINSRKIRYKYGWFKRSLRIYRIDVKEFRLTKNDLIVLMKDREEYTIHLKDFSENAKLVLKHYLDIINESNTS